MKGNCDSKKCIKTQMLILEVNIKMIYNNVRTRHFLLLVGLLGVFLHVMNQCCVAASEFHLEGLYLIGGLFDIHLI